MSAHSSRSSKAAATAGGGAAVRTLTSSDFEAVVAIDAAIGGRSRREYVERRLREALKNPKLHVQFGVDHDGQLAGYVLARRLNGEFGRPEPGVRLELIGVRRSEQGHGIGDWLLTSLVKWAREHGVSAIRTQAAWRNHVMLRYFDHAGFELGRNQVIESAVHPGPLGAEESGSPAAPGFESASRELDYGAPPANDFESLARDRAAVSSLDVGDLPDIVRIDRRIVGRNREDYMRRLVTEALDDSAVRVSLTARKDGIIAGFVMAKTDFGDFGRPEPVAVIDTIGVDPDFTKHGIGAALMSQLYVNLHALGVERVETVVARENFPLLGFFYKAGFAASDRLAFVRRV